MIITITGVIESKEMNWMVMILRGLSEDLEETRVGRENKTLPSHWDPPKENNNYVLSEIYCTVLYFACTSLAVLYCTSTCPANGIHLNSYNKSTVLYCSIEQHCTYFTLMNLGSIRIYQS